MRLTKLKTHGWRNLVSASLDCDAPLIVIHGENGQGKSNLLEAVHVMGTLKSFREPRARRWIGHNEPGARLDATVQSTLGQRQLVWRWSDGQRQLHMDDKAIGELSTWFEVLRAVVFCPEDSRIVRGEPEQRRRFMDRAAFSAWPEHLTAVTEYRKVLGHKRALLQSRWVDPLQLDAFDASLARLGALVIHRRIAVIEALRQTFNDKHGAIAGTGEVSLRVRASGISEVENCNLEDIEAQLASAMERKREDEINKGQALIGPHRDDLSIEIDGQLARNFASQGQARSLVLGLKLAQLEHAHSQGHVPLFLLDDLTSELDQGRRARLVEVLTHLKGQVWITTTEPKYLGDLTEMDHALLAVRDGKITRE